MRAVFRKLYVNLKRDKGYMFADIITYEKFPDLYTTKTLSLDEQKIKGYSIEIITMTYQHYLMLDLWIVILDWNWTTRTKAYDKTKPTNN